MVARLIETANDKPPKLTSRKRASLAYLSQSSVEKNGSQDKHVGWTLESCTAVTHQPRPKVIPMFRYLTFRTYDTSVVKLPSGGRMHWLSAPGHICCRELCLVESTTRTDTIKTSHIWQYQCYHNAVVHQDAMCSTFMHVTRQITVLNNDTNNDSVDHHR